VLIGFPFVMISTTLNSIIRADGDPKLAMISLAFGAVLNTILDPIFIFVLGWGVQGAAFATIIGQIVAFFVSLS
jgi:Na+-driven multidrug efflux pump